MKLSVFSAKPYDKKYLGQTLSAKHADSGFSIAYHDYPLNEKTVSLVKDDVDAVCVFVNDSLNADVIAALADRRVKAILLRCAGSNNVDLAAASDRGIVVANVPAYSPEAVAEFAVALLQTLNRRTHRAYNRVREGNFAIDGLLGRTLHGQTVGVLGVGKIGLALARIMKGFGCRVLAYDPFPTPAFEEFGEYRELDELLPECDIISLHCPLMDKTRHIVNDDSIAKMKKGVVIINTSRGGLIDTTALIKGLKSEHIGAVGLDVYEGEGNLFYSDHSGEIIQDDLLMRLMTFPNVLVCGHQAFFTSEALTEIAECTLRSLEDVKAGLHPKSSLTKEPKSKPNEPLPVRTV
ncbi:hypothetical protein S7711_05503 [Stachybotrys chartarum IBT 7711]|uniref:D-lactate dehydrogenase n=1 Tax=Stachybotrys chartarum (strain CBS 109288 / IBT 7711) TaxID=1280523 RepID=A0A084AS13_STACB|nr:hypothetical protein S7711_05503 [Stachybotrys chartarum IBT 7711]KFA76137.1 hypothetical protein S40288_00345 [Stachybotrys chartarum IBT 40288]